MKAFRRDEILSHNKVTFFSRSFIALQVWKKSTGNANTDKQTFHYISIIYFLNL